MARFALVCTLLCTVVAGPAHAASLDQFPDTWATNNPVACRTNPYAISLSDGLLTFTDGRGAISTERVIEDRPDGFVAATERSPTVSPGWQWSYLCVGADQVHVRDLQTGRFSRLIRCGEGVADAALVAEAMLTQMFATYLGGSGVNTANTEELDRFVTPALSSAMARVVAVARERNEAPCLNGDPFIGNQETRITDVRVLMASAGAGRASAAVSYRSAGVAQGGVFQLLETAHGWRIDDVGNRSFPSLRRFLAACP